MKPHEIIQVSVDGLIANKLRTILTVLGVIIGVASIVLLISLSLEVRSQITGSVKLLGSNLFLVFPANPQSFNAAFAASKLSIITIGIMRFIVLSRPYSLPSNLPLVLFWLYLEYILNKPSVLPTILSKRFHSLSVVL